MNDSTRMPGDEAEERPAAAEQLITLLYGELRAMASREMSSERTGHTLQPTALVHEAYLRLAGVDGREFESRGHFFCAAATAIRRILVEHARRRARVKRGGGRARVGLGGVEPSERRGALSDEALVAVDDVLGRLAEFAPELAQVVELRFFVGLTIGDTARALGVSETKIQRDWRLARAWLRDALAGADGPPRHGTHAGGRHGT